MVRVLNFETFGGVVDSCNKAFGVYVKTRSEPMNDSPRSIRSTETCDKVEFLDLSKLQGENLNTTKDMVVMYYPLKIGVLSYGFLSCNIKSKNTETVIMNKIYKTMQDLALELLCETSESESETESESSNYESEIEPETESESSNYESESESDTESESNVYESESESSIYESESEGTSEKIIKVTSGPKCSCYCVMEFKQFCNCGCICSDCTKVNSVPELSTPVGLNYFSEWLFMYNVMTSLLSFVVIFLLNQLFF